MEEIEELTNHIDALGGRDLHEEDFTHISHMTSKDDNVKFMIMYEFHVDSRYSERI